MDNSALRGRLVKTYKRAGWACVAAMALSIPLKSPHLAGCAAIAMAGWGACCLLSWPAERIKLAAKGTRAPRRDLFDKMLARQSKSFKKLGPIEQAAAARLDPSIQRRLWWDAAAVMWMQSNPGQEHAWRGLLSAPGWLDDAIAWRDEVAASLEAAADRGWICPSANVAWLIGAPEMESSKRELGEAIEGFASLGEPWPAQARFCDTLASMGHKLYDKGFAEALAWRSHGALERLSIAHDMDALGGRELRSRGKLRL